MKYLVLSLLLAVSAWAQEAKFYRLEFTVKELDEARVVSAKKYTTYSTTDEKHRGASIRTGTRVPMQTGPGQVQYYDVGVNIDVRQIREMGAQLMVDVQAEISSIPAGETPVTAAPVVRQNRWSATATVELGKATTLFSSDDLNSKRKMQLEVLATVVK